MRPLIDLDIVVYSAGFSSQRKRLKVTLKSGKEYTMRSGINRRTVLSKFPDAKIESLELEVDPDYFAFHKAKKIINSILEYFNAEKKDMTGFLTASNDPTQFRKLIAKTKEYKGNRKDTPRPVHYEAIRDYIYQNYPTEIIHCYEADDALAMTHSDNPDDTVICTSDKDLLQIPGKHFRLRSKEYLEVDKRQGDYNLFGQILTGDVADNIPGIRGIGPKRADQYLSNSVNFYETTRAAYKTSDLSDDRYFEVANLLFIRRREGQSFEDYIGVPNHVNQEI